jgi:hypothetical protein
VRRCLVVTLTTDRIIDPETDNARTYATSARAHVLCELQAPS